MRSDHERAMEAKARELAKATGRPGLWELFLGQAYAEAAGLSSQDFAPDRRTLDAIREVGNERE
jgi:hypothetical protein